MDPAPGLDASSLATLCPHLSPENVAQAASRLQAYEALLAKWAGRINLVAAGDLPYLWSRHLRPSLELCPLVRALPHRQIVDVGSGAGLPGVPLAVTLPGVSVTLVESRRRRAHFLRHVVRDLDMGTVTVVAGRVEDWIPSDPVDLVVSRAVTRPGDLVRITQGCRAAHAFLITTSGPRSAPALQGTSCLWDRPAQPGRTWVQLFRP